MASRSSSRPPRSSSPPRCRPTACSSCASAWKRSARCWPGRSGACALVNSPARRAQHLPRADDRAASRRPTWPSSPSRLVTTSDADVGAPGCRSGSSAPTSTTRRRATWSSRETPDAVAAALAGLAARGIARAVLQPHVDGRPHQVLRHRPRRRRPGRRAALVPLVLPQGPAPGRPCLRPGARSARLVRAGRRRARPRDLRRRRHRDRGRRARAARPQRVAELRALPRRGRAGASRRTWRCASARAGAGAGGERARASPGRARGRSWRASAPHRARLPVLRALLGAGHGARQRVRRSCDEDGNEYIDFIAGIAVGSVGHCHPHYVEALEAPGRAADLRQLHHRDARALPRAARLRHAGGAHAHPALLGRRGGGGGGAAPGQGRDRASTRSSASGAASTARPAACWACSAATSSTTWVRSCPASTRRRTPTATAARSSSRYPDCGIACAEYVRDVIRYQTAGEIAAIIVEPIQGTAGNVIPPDGFLRAIQSIAQEHGALLFADEMITGFGRTGSMWGAEHDGVVPDIMTVGKGMGGGFPLTARDLDRRADERQALVQSELQLVELRRQPARRGGGARRARDHPEGGSRQERRARRRGHARRARSAEGEVPHASARCAAAGCCSASSW